MIKSKRWIRRHRHTDPRLVTLTKYLKQGKNCIRASGSEFYVYPLIKKLYLHSFRKRDYSMVSQVIYQGWSLLDSTLYPAQCINECLATLIEVLCKGVDSSVHVISTTSSDSQILSWYKS